MLDANLIEERIEPIEVVHVRVGEDEAPDLGESKLVRQVVKRIGPPVRARSAPLSCPSPPREPAPTRSGSRYPNTSSARAFSCHFLV